jgi:hypothetical protein
MLKPSRFLLMVLGAGGLPYALSSTTRLEDNPPAATAEAEGSAGATEPTTAQGVVAQPPGSRAKTLGPPRLDTSLEGSGVNQLEQVFRFDVTTAWVMGHWSRVSTSLAELNLQGYRVPLVTGTKDSDLAGSLSYYFNPQQRVQRITFQGTTGDARPLVGLLVARHGFIRVVDKDPRLFLYQVKEGRTVIGDLRITPSAIVRMDDPHARFDVVLTMTRPKALK